MSTQSASAPYPVRYDVEYPSTPRNRLTVFFRIFLVIPVLIVFGLVGGGGNAGWRASDGDSVREPSGLQRRFERDLTDEQRRGVVGAVVGLVVTAALLTPAAVSAGAGMGASAAPLAAPTALMLLFRRKYPRWWYEFSLQLGRFGGRVGAYAAL